MPPPTVSVVICAYTVDRWESLRAAVASVESQDRFDGSPADPPLVGSIEIAVVVDHCDDLFTRASAEWPEHVVVANASRRGLSGARNTGVAATRGELVAFLDDDATADPRWLARLARHFDDPSVWGVGGHVEPDFEGGDPAWLPEEFGWVVGCSYRGQPTEVREVRNPIGANMAFRRRAFAVAGGFRDGMGRIGKVPLGCEETEFAIRVRDRGGRVLHDPSARVRHSVPLERVRWRYFVRRCWAEGLSKAAVVDVSGREAGLSAERSYVAGVLPSALWQSAQHTVAGPRRWSAAGRGVAILTGSLVTAGGFARGRLAGVGHGGVDR